MLSDSAEGAGASMLVIIIIIVIVIVIDIDIDLKAITMKKRLRSRSRSRLRSRITIEDQDHDLCVSAYAVRRLAWRSQWPTPPTTCLAGPGCKLPPPSTPLMSATISGFTVDGYALLNSCTDMARSRCTTLTFAGWTLSAAESFSAEKLPIEPRKVPSYACSLPAGV